MLQIKTKSTLRRGAWLAAGTLVLGMAFTACNEPSSNPPAEAPVITVQPVNRVAVVGASVSLIVKATGATSYKWVRGTSDTLSGQTSDTLTLSALTLTQHGTQYKAIAIGEGGIAVSSSATVWVFQPENGVPLSDYFVPRATLIDTGAVVFQNCSGCHGSEGHGYAGAVPPLANSNFFMADRKRVMRIVLGGYSEAITVNGVHYQGDMPSWAESLSDIKIASVLTYLRSQLNDSTVVSCDTTVIDDFGFAACTKTPRSAAERAIDSVGVWEVAFMRDSLDLPPVNP